ncbi:Borealin N terminal-domain-containing protein [Xylariaceae sp. FL0804]|nr:Borealin N terminal-domain-containing protein [Xylariaceae sp. FL0804]
MAPTRLRKRKSEHTPTASLERSPIKKRKMGITITQKQALIDNLQLEVTERARRLRAQYNIQAQQLRSRVEMRVNRIPRTLRRVPMGELLAKSLEPQQQAQASKAPYVAKPPPVPAKDNSSSPVFTRKPVPPSNYRHEIQHLSHEMTADKENQADHVDSPKRRPRGAPAKDSAPVAAQILSPTSSNARIVPRERPASPTKSLIGRPASPVKRPTTKASSNILSSMLEFGATGCCGGGGGGDGGTHAKSRRRRTPIGRRHARTAKAERCERVERGEHRYRGQEDDGVESSQDGPDDEEDSHGNHQIGHHEESPRPKACRRARSHYGKDVEEEKVGGFQKCTHEDRIERGAGYFHKSAATILFA